MSKKKKTASRARAKSTARAKRFRLPTVSFADAWPWVNRVFLGVIVLGAVVGVVFGVAPLQERVGRLRADPLVVEIAWPLIAGDPERTWLNIEEQDRLRDLALAHLAADPFDFASLEETQAALFGAGWLREPPRIVRKPGGVIEIQGVWRMPVAVVRSGEWERLVSRDGALLPVRYPIGGSGELPIITGAFTGPPRKADGSEAFGAVWPGGDIPAAIALFDYLRQSDRYSKVVSIDASRYVTKGLLTIVTTNGGRIVWGAAPGQGAPGEVRDAVKLTRFEKLFADATWLGADRPPVEINTSLVLIDESARR